MKINLNEEVFIYHDDETGIDYISSDGKTLRPLNAAEFAPSVGLSNKRDYDKDALSKFYKDRADKVTKDSDDEYKKRLDDIKGFRNNKEVEKRLDRENTSHTGREKRIVDKGADKKVYTSHKSRGGVDKFKIDLKKVIGSQVFDYTQDSYGAFNPVYDNTDFIMPGTKTGEIKNKPMINVYYDYSASWDSSDIKKGNSAVSCIDDFRKSGLIEYNLYYFSQTVTDYVPTQGGTNGQYVMEHIQKTKPDNVIVMTDSDWTGWSNDDCKWDDKQVIVPGGVFFLWKDGSESEGFKKYLHGKKCTWGYEIN